MIDTNPAISKIPLNTSSPNIPIRRQTVGVYKKNFQLYVVYKNSTLNIYSDRFKRVRK